MSENRIELCGFVFRHGDKDYEAWEVTLDEPDEVAIMKILSNYETSGCSLRMVIGEGEKNDDHRQ